MEKDISIGLCSSGSRLIVAIEHDGQIKSMRRKLFSQETALFPTVEKLLPPGKYLSSIKEVCALKNFKDLNEAFEIIRSLSKYGDVCLLSPAAASYDQYRNFEERGRFFKALSRAFTSSSL